MDKEQHEILGKKEIGYLAALVDLQATFYIYEDPRDSRPNPEINLQIIITSPDYELLSYWRAKTGLGSVHPNSRGYHWRLSAATAEKLLRLVDGHLMTAHTQAQARIGLDFRKTFTGSGVLDEGTIAKRRWFRKMMMELAIGI